MKTKSLLLCVALWLGVGAICQASPFDSYMGTWKLNQAKSKIPRGVGRNMLVRYEWEWFSTRVTVDGWDGRGHKTHSEWTGRFDGKDYAVKGAADEDTRAYMEVNDNNLRFISKKRGRVTRVGQAVIAPDGKTRTVTTWTPGRHGKKMRAVAFYDKA